MNSVSIDDSFVSVIIHKMQ